MPDLRSWPAPLTLRRIILVALVATAAIFLIIQWHDRPLSPQTIVALELAWTPATAVKLLETTWGAPNLPVAVGSLQIDFAFMPAYAFLFAGLVLVTSRGVRDRLQTLGFWLCAAPFVAWACDLTENFSLLRVLAVPTDPSAAALLLAGLAASIKFALLGVCLVYALIAFIVHRSK